MKKTATLQWYQTRRADVAWCLLALLTSYLLASRALDTGSLIEYFIAIVLLLVSVRFLVRTFKR